MVSDCVAEKAADAVSESLTVVEGDPVSDGACIEEAVSIGIELVLAVTTEEAGPLIETVCVAGIEAAGVGEKEPVADELTLEVQPKPRHSSTSPTTH